MSTPSTQRVSEALDAYRRAVSDTRDPQDREDYFRLIAITEKLIAAVQSSDMVAAKECMLAFTRHVTDSYAVQPQQYRALSDEVQRLEEQLT